MNDANQHAPETRNGAPERARGPVAEIAEGGVVRWFSIETPLPAGTKLFASETQDDCLLAFAAPTGLHPRTAGLVVRFAAALAAKLALAERKYGHSDGWADPSWMDGCRAALVEHVAKGDPRDVAAYCAFLWYHGQSTAAPKPEGEVTKADIRLVITSRPHTGQGIRQWANIGNLPDGEYFLCVAPRVMLTAATHQEPGADTERAGGE